MTAEMDYLYCFHVAIVLNKKTKIIFNSEREKLQVWNVLKYIFWSVVVSNSYNPTKETVTGSQACAAHSKFEASLGYRVKSCVK